MFEINSSFIISSRLSTLSSQDILRIIHIAEKKWNQRQVKERMKKDKSIIGIGISNPQELNQVIKDDIPIIHISNNCKSLQAVEKKRNRNIKILNRILMIGTSTLWGIFGYYNLYGFNKLFKRGNDITEIKIFNRGIIPIPNYIIISTTISITTLLTLFTKKLLLKDIRNEYQYHQNGGEFILFRNDILYSKFKYFIQIILPYCCFIGLSFYHFKNKNKLKLYSFSN